MDVCKNNFERLLEVGKKAGFLESNQILSVFENSDLDVTMLNKFYEDCKKAKILITETAEQEENEIEENNADEIKTDDCYLKDDIKMYLRSIRNYPLLTAEEERNLSEAIRTGTPEEVKLARKKLVEGNLKLVVSVAKNYVNNTTNLMDAIQDGNMGLMKAADKFDSRLGFKFSTYATWWIRQSINRAAADTSRIIRLPNNVHEKKKKLRRAANEFFAMQGREPNIEELSKMLSWSKETVERLVLINDEITSLSTPIGDDDDALLQDFVPDPNAPSGEEILRKLEVSNFISVAYSVLKDREVDVLSMRYGLIDGNAKTLGEIGKELNLTRERVRQIENIALKKIRVKLKIRCSTFTDY